MPEITLQDALQQAVTLHQDGKTAEALEKYQEILAAIPDQVDALKLSGIAHMQLGNMEKAVELLQKSISLSPSYDDAHYNLAVAYQLLGRLQDAESSFQRVLELAPDNITAMFSLANLYKSVGRLNEAAEAYRKVIAIDSSHIAAVVNLGAVLVGSGDLDEAEEALRKAAGIHPGSAEIQLNIGAVHLEAGKLEAAEQAFLHALEIRPDFIEALANLASILQKTGRIADADALYTKALQIAPERMDVFRNYLLNLLYMPGKRDGFNFSKNREFAAAFPRLESARQPHDNIQDPDKKLKIGFISSDFRAHSVAYNILPLLSNIDSENFETYLYAEVPNPDGMTDRFRNVCDYWRDIFAHPDETVARTIRNDGIDLLVFLAGHFDQNRLPVCVFRPAPVQISFHDGATSGFDEMDYWLTDSALHPENSPEQFSEDLYRLPVFYQYTPIVNAPPVSPRLIERNRTITFGSFNNPGKINNEVIALWTNILNEITDSRLMLKYRGVFDNPKLNQAWLERFSANGIAPERIILRGGKGDSRNHLASYNEVDIALDPFPFNGATTTVEALWMGVPVISLMGDHFISRAAGSILHHAGHGNLAVPTPADYVELARDLAGNPARLKSLRENLRQDIQNSPLCNAPAYALSIEAAFRDMWKKWCNGQKV